MHADAVSVNSTALLGSALSDLSAEQDELDRVMAERQLSDSTLLSSISFNGTELFFDASSHRYFYSLTENETDPAVSFTGGSDTKVVFLTGDITQEAIRENRAIPFIAYNDSYYFPYRLVVTTLPLMSLEGGEIGVGDVLTTMSLYDNETGSLTESQANIHIRGGSSTLYPKKGYKLSLVERGIGGDFKKTDRKLLDLRYDDDWILYAAYNDPEKMRNSLANSLWMDSGARNNSFSLCNGTDARFVELFMNGTYQGLYVLMYPVDAHQLGLTASNDPAESEYRYRSISYVATKSEDFKAASNSCFAGRFELKFPDNMDDTYLKWQPLDELMQLIESSSDEEFAREIFSMTEQSNIIDLWLFQNVTCSVDNIDKNINYFAKRCGEGYVFLMSPWDLDQTWGNIWTDGSPLLTQVNAGILQGAVAPGKLMDRALALNVGNLRENILSRWKELRTGAFSNEAVLKQINSYAADVFDSGALRRDQSRWPESIYAPDAETFKAYVMDRLDFVDTYIEEMCQS